MSKKLSKMFGGGLDTSKMVVLVGLVLFLVLGYYYITQNNNTQQVENNNPEPAQQLQEGFNDNTSLSPGANEIVVALFAADWCPHCQDLKPTWANVSKQFNGSDYNGNSLRFVNVDCTESCPASADYEVEGYPTIVVITRKGFKQVEERSIEGVKKAVDSLM